MPEAALRAWRERIDAALAASLPDRTQSPQALHAAMHHAVLLGGKRMRPLLVHASGALFGADPTALDAPAVAIELVHAYSLVHDDLPCMDDDALRRGQPTVHVAFDEATAVLAGDALQTLAFEVLGRAPLPPDIALQLVHTLAGASGASGMCGGQALDLAATGAAAPLSLAELERLHALKTGALIRAAVRMGALVGRAEAGALAELDRFACALGLAFQVRDDILDVEGDSATLGKTAGKDAAQSKATFPALLGLEGSHARLQALAAEMREALAGFDERAATLVSLGEFAVQRRN